MWNSIVAGRRAAVVLLELLRRWRPAAEERSPRQVSADRFGWSSTPGRINTRKNRNFKNSAVGGWSRRFFRLSRRTNSPVISAVVRHPKHHRTIPQHVDKKPLTGPDGDRSALRAATLLADFPRRQGKPPAGRRPHTHAPSSFSQGAAALPGGVRICLRPGVPALPRRVVLGAGFDPAFAGRGLLALPERRFGLQPVDQEMAGGKFRLSSAPRPSCARSTRNRSWRRGPARWGRGRGRRDRR